VRRVLRDNGLSIAMFGLFALFLLGQSIAGHRTYNEEQRSHDDPTVDYGAYLRTPHFAEAVFENWESEFLQMGAYVMLTVFLFQKGSSESKDPDGEEAVDADPRETRGNPDAPWPVRRGGLPLWLYERSLGPTMLLLFALSFIGHAAGGAREYSAEQTAHGESGVSTAAYLRTAQFWFESFQNWQSEFLAVGTLIVLSIVLRQRGSPESKPVAASYGETGTS